MSRKGKPVAFQFYATDWLSDDLVTIMPLEAQGAYVRLMAHCSTRDDHGLPVDVDAVRKLASADPAEWERIWPHLERHWPVVGGLRRNPKLSEVLADRDDYRRRQAENGAKGARKRWDGQENGGANGVANGGANGERIATPMANGMANGCPLDSSPTPTPPQTPETQTPERRARARATPGAAKPRTKASRRKAAENHELPASVGGDRFRNVWGTWVDHVYQRTNPTDTAIDAQAAKLDGLTPEQAERLIRDAIGANAQGFPPWAVERAREGGRGAPRRDRHAALAQLEIVPNRPERNGRVI